MSNNAASSGGGTSKSRIDESSLSAFEDKKIKNHDLISN